MSLDEQFTEQSQKYGIGVAKLKTVYLRGVRAFQDAGVSTGTANMWGLARVQRFINAVTADATPDLDADLVATPVVRASDPGLEISVEAGTLITDILYSSGERTAQMFEPGTVLCMQIEDQLFTVEGVLDGREWLYSLDTVSGEHTLSIK